MIIEDYKRINGWLNVRVNIVGNQSSYDFSEYVDGVKHTLSEAHELYNLFKNDQPERSKREDCNKCWSCGFEIGTQQSCYRCGTLNTMET
jgi:hypothetical protein